MKKATFILLIGLGFASCKDEMNIDYVIENASQESIFVKGEDQLKGESIDVEIGANQDMVIANYYDKDKEVTAYEPKVVLGCEMIVTNASGDTMTTLYTDESIWQKTKSKDGDDTDITYSLFLTESDFQ
ncbi:hypothetical protein SAMN05216474_0604 [Lishizhenia tianjinensis]|uniref:Lipoprotein n=1 Tax=Lishizhenia tianjinensis TaxID=477690 RepID=A0A1I6Y1H0_9FLAO|nr:hypothetical protein [Lishizhenia tianjinensis]SFT44455.1 hypothetical protein SAMN05216474_0604 [Lishizhenia tianjinensis]